MPMLIAMRCRLHGAGRTKELDSPPKRVIDRARSVTQRLARLGRIEEHSLARHPDLGEARARWTPGNRARDRLGAEREGPCDGVWHANPRRAHARQLRQA